MTVRKCLSAQNGKCYQCDSVCVCCGTKKYSVETECELCMLCEKNLSGAEQAKLEKESMGISEDEIEIIVVTG